MKLPLPLEAALAPSGLGMCPRSYTRAAEGRKGPGTRRPGPRSELVAPRAGGVCPSEGTPGCILTPFSR